MSENESGKKQDSFTKENLDEVLSELGKAFRKMNGTKNNKEFFDMMKG